VTGPSASAVIRRLYPWLRHLFADGAYAGDKLRDGLAGLGRFTIDIIKRSDTTKGFEVLPRKWVVESTSPGSGAAAASPKTSRPPSPVPSHGSSSPKSACSPSGSQEPDLRAL
jgi:transposase